jgi:hypothetical protein
MSSLPVGCCSGNALDTQTIGKVPDLNADRVMVCRALGFAFFSTISPDKY